MAMTHEQVRHSGECPHLHDEAVGCCVRVGAVWVVASSGVIISASPVAFFNAGAAREDVAIGGGCNAPTLILDQGRLALVGNFTRRKLRVPGHRAVAHAHAVRLAAKYTRGLTCSVAIFATSFLAAVAVATDDKRGAVRADRKVGTLLVRFPSRGAMVDGAPHSRAVRLQLGN